MHDELLEMDVVLILVSTGWDLGLKRGKFWIESLVKSPLKKEVSEKYEKSNETMTLMRENMGRYEKNVFLKKEHYSLLSDRLCFITVDTI